MQVRLLMKPSAPAASRCTCNGHAACIRAGVTHLYDASTHSWCRVFVNAELSGVQLRNLEAAWGRPVVDRVGLIIEIFAQRARTREARLQVNPHSIFDAGHWME